jgi:hypothetical protein
MAAADVKLGLIELSCVEHRAEGVPMLLWSADPACSRRGGAVQFMTRAADLHWLALVF